MRPKLTVLVDIDGTLNEFTKPFIAKVRELGYEFNEERYSWELSDAITGTDDPKAVVAEVFKDITFWDSLKPREYSQEALRILNNRYDVKIATIPWRAVPEYINSKINWLRKYYRFISPEQITFQKDKWNIPGDIIIDDKPETLEKCRATKVTVKPLQPYNKDVAADYTFSSWDQVSRLFRYIDRVMEGV